MKDDGVTANNQVSNAMGMEGGLIHAPLGCFY